MKIFKYFAPISVYYLAFKSFYHTGFIVWLPVIYAFVVIPILELLFKPNMHNLSKVEEDFAKSNRLYDFMLYIILPFQFTALYIFLRSFDQNNLSWIDIIGRISSMGLLCGIFGINVGHELGHRVNNLERIIAKLLLMSSLYMHFFIEHNKGHHKNVATPIDPASSKLNEPIYNFFFRTIKFSYLSAWQIANLDNLKSDKKSNFLGNEMLQYHVIQLVFLLVIGIGFGLKVLLFFIAASLVGILLLETVNYIEHYGLVRNRLESGAYERTLPIHSWNSDHVVGRIFLFELSRHSDHHYMASRKYQILRSHTEAPMLPTGYPGSMLLSLVPPLWFSIMNKKIENMSVY